MQDRYTGDVGDFGKLGLLRCIAAQGLRIGVNWCFVQDEVGNGDGRHIGYLNNVKFCNCDDVLLGKLRTIISENDRRVARLESADLIPGALYYRTPLQSPRAQDFDRQKWHSDALRTLAGADIVFLDPDNGLQVKSVSMGSAKSKKYVTAQELADYYASGKSVIFYNHRCRQQECEYMKRFDDLQSMPEFHDAMWQGVKFCRGTTRDYIMILQPEHQAQTAKAVNELLVGPWSRHFVALSFNNL